MGAGDDDWLNAVVPRDKSGMMRQNRNDRPLRGGETKAPHDD
jgi:hypothetical protein